MALRKIKRADVPRYVAVKEGSEHPVNKKGQYKLFHTHQWPKGYTPERRRAISEIQFPVVGSGLVGEGQNEASHKVARDFVEKTLAKSTVPTERLKDLVLSPGEPGLSAVNTSVVVGDYGSKPEAFYIPGHNAIHIRNTSGFRGPTNTSYALMHEMGHATDFFENPGQFMAKSHEESNYPYSRAVGGAHPSLEGTADAFALAHTRITRADERNSLSGNETLAGYEREHWAVPAHGNEYVETKARVYRQESGQELSYDEGEADLKPKVKRTRKKKQPTLFDNEP